MTKETRYIGSFVIVDAQGETHPTNVTQEFWITSQVPTPGLKIATTTTGYQVVPLGLRKQDGSRDYKLVSLTSGVTIYATCDDPDQSCFDP